MLLDGVISASVITKNGKIVAVLKDYSNDVGTNDEYVLDIT